MTPLGEFRKNDGTLSTRKQILEIMAFIKHRKKLSCIIFIIIVMSVIFFTKFRIINIHNNYIPCYVIKSGMGTLRYGGELKYKDVYTLSCLNICTDLGNIFLERFNNFKIKENGSISIYKPKNKFTNNLKILGYENMTVMYITIYKEEMYLSDFNQSFAIDGMEYNVSLICYDFKQKIYSVHASSDYIDSNLRYYIQLTFEGKIIKIIEDLGF